MGVRFRDSFSSASVPTNNVLPEIDRDLIPPLHCTAGGAAEAFRGNAFARSQRAADA